jgi:methylmalonyl-CoA mutase C-terminal domain/subunit
VFAGGVIPEKDVVKLKKMGVLRVYTPGAATSDIVNFVLRAKTEISERDLSNERISV